MCARVERTRHLRVFAVPRPEHLPFRFRRFHRPRRARKQQHTLPKRRIVQPRGNLAILVEGTKRLSARSVTSARSWSESGDATPIVGPKLRGVPSRRRNE